jgi:hypothetical protein
MAKKGGLGRTFAEIQAANPTGGYHPLITPLTFDAITRANGGATMDAHTGEFLDVSDPSKDAYVVGKEPDTEGKPIPTTPLSAAQGAVGHLSRIRRDIIAKTGNRPGVAVGSWTTGDRVDIDASALEPSLHKAMAKATERNEEAIFSTKKFRESGYKDGDIRNPNYKPNPEA